MFRKTRRIIGVIAGCPPKTIFAGGMAAVITARMLSRMAMTSAVAKYRSSRSGSGMLADKNMEEFI